MYNTEIIYNALKNHGSEGEDLEGKEKCFVCGKTIKQGIKIKKVISEKFTNYSECKYKEGQYICKECATVIRERSLRTNSFIADSEHLYLLKKNDIENYLFNLEQYIKDEFVIGITQSFKKHNSFRCKVNSDPKRFYIREEDREYVFEASKLKHIYTKLNEAYLQFSKEELQTGRYKMISIEQFGLGKFTEYEDIFKQYRGSPQFDLMIYMMNSEKRNEYVKEKQKQQKEEKTKLKALEKQKKKINGNSGEQISLF